MMRNATSRQLGAIVTKCVVASSSKYPATSPAFFRGVLYALRSASFIPEGTFRAKRTMNKSNPFRGHDYDPNREPRSNCGYFDGDHLYGVAPIRLAISAGRRTIRELLVQEGNEPKSKADKILAAELLELAIRKGIKVREFCKHDLNMLVENRDHQGFVLRVAPLQLDKIDKLEKSETFRCVLALDEIADPQNFGALLRTSHYLGVERVIIRGKNSAPLSPTVSSTSSGALESIVINTVDSMMNFLEESKKNGWQVCNFHEKMHLCLFIFTFHGFIFFTINILYQF